MLTEPTIRFSKWVRWSDRGALASGTPCMGVYLWAHFRKSPPPPETRPFPDLPEELVYIGEANDLNVRPLNGRHHRLKHYVDQFRDPKYEHLYVSICDVGPFQRSDPNCHALRAFTKYLEARLGWEYTRKFGRRPRLDYKEGKDESYVPRLRMAVAKQPNSAVHRPGARVARSGR